MLAKTGTVTFSPGPSCVAWTHFPVLVQQGGSSLGSPYSEGAGVHTCPGRLLALPQKPPTPVAPGS